SGRPVAQQRLGDASAVRTAMSSTPVLSRAQGHVAGVQHTLASANTVIASLFGSQSSLLRSVDSLFAPVVSCGAAGTIAAKSGFEDADGNLVVNTAGCMDWNGFAPVTWTGSAPYQNSTTTNGNFTFFGVSDAFNDQTDTSYAGGIK